MKKVFSILFLAAIVAVFSMSLRHSFNDYGVRDGNSLQMQVLAQTNDSNCGCGDSNGGGTTTWGCGGNPTWVPNQSLQQKTCIIFITYRRICDDMANVCCDPAQQVSCTGVLPDINL